MPRISQQDLIAFGTRLLSAKGLKQSDAHYLAANATEVASMGVTTHGLPQLCVIVAAIDRGDIDPRGTPAIIREKAAIALIDAKGAPGQLAMRLAIATAMNKARQAGVGWAGVSRTTWIGALGVFLVPVAKEGFFAQMFAQDSHCQDSPPAGGIDAMFSTNPIALAFPTDGDPIVADFSTCAMSMGKTTQLARQGRKAPAKIFFDRDGNPTDDPKVVSATSEGGSIQFMGGDHNEHKGYALSFWIEALTAMIGGACNNPDLPLRQSFSVCVIDPNAFADSAHYLAEIERFKKRVKSSRVRPGFGEIRFPGERSQRLARESASQGVEVANDLFEQLNGLARAAGVDELGAAPCG